jgi:hypothetical protein
MLSAMARYKGQARPEVTERDFPNIVEIVVPLGGLGRRLDTMHAWHSRRHLPPRHGRSRREGDRDTIRWCFAEAAIAQAFAGEFGGKLLVEDR